MAEDHLPYPPLYQYATQSPNSLRARPELEQISNMENMVPTFGVLPPLTSPELPRLQATQMNEPHGWFYCLPRFRQSFAPLLGSNLEEKFSWGPSTVAQKKFLVFDGSGDGVTVFLSSGSPNPQYLTTASSKPTVGSNLNVHDIDKKDQCYHFEPILADEFDKNHEAGLESEVHVDDTEELDALLYSDDDDDRDSADDEVTSTAHSPGDGTEWFEGITEEVASSDGPTKKRKLPEEFYGAVSPIECDCSAKRKNGEDAESSCHDILFERSGSLSSNKRKKKEKIRATMNALQGAFPGGQDKDAIVVLDEAIRYLKWLKLKVQGLGREAPGSS